MDYSFISLKLNDLITKNVNSTLKDYFAEKLNDILEKYTLNGDIYYRIYHLGPMTSKDVASLTLGEIDEIVDVHLRGESIVDELNSFIGTAKLFGANEASLSIYDDLCLVTVAFKDEQLKYSFSLVN